MKKILSLFAILFLTTIKANADYIPRYANPKTYYGRGVILIKNKVDVYKSDNDLSDIEAILEGDKIKENGSKNPTVENTYIVLSKEKQIFALPIENDTDEWFYVCYNQAKKLFGWVKKTEDIDYMGWQEFFNIYGRKYGIYVFKNVPKKYKNLYSSPSEDSTLADSFDIDRNISLWLIRGDWILVKVTTYDGKTKTGWLRWRTQNGTVIAFPDFRDTNY